MKLIVAGLGRSGTTSLGKALPILGLNTLVQDNLFRDANKHAHINAVARGRLSLNPQILEGVDASVGWPLCWTVKEQLECYPEAKVLLNVRDPEAWFDSIERAMATVKVVRKLRFMQKLRHINETMDILFERMGNEKLDRDRWLAGYHAHNEGIKALVSPEKLLVYEVHEEWEPLCAFLGLPVPDEAFPMENVGGRESLKQKLRDIFGIGANKESAD